MGGPELLDLPLGGLFHPLAHFVDLAPNHIVKLAVVPYQLDVPKYFLVCAVLPCKKFLLASCQVHRILDNLGVVEQAHLCIKHEKDVLDSLKIRSG